MNSVILGTPRKHVTLGKLVCTALTFLAAAWPVLGQESSARQPQRVADVYRQLFKERQKNIERLRNYHQQGTFPRNYDFPVHTPYFVDAHGTHCAMAQLVKDSGAVDIVQQVVKLNNNIYVNDVKDGPFMEWMLWSGLTQEECARIQPRYKPRPPIDELERLRLQVATQNALINTLQETIKGLQIRLEAALRLDPDDRRVKEHLTRVEAELSANTFPSLSRAMSVLRSRNKELFLGKSYAVVAPPAKKQELATIKLKNTSKSQQIEVMLTFIDGQGNIVRQELPKFQAQSEFHTRMFAVNQEVDVTYTCDNTWVVVEWTAGPVLAVNVPFETIADKSSK